MVKTTKEFVEHLHQLLGRAARGEAGEANDIGKENADIVGVADIELPEGVEVVVSLLLAVTTHNDLVDGIVSHGRREHRAQETILQNHTKDRDN